MAKGDLIGKTVNELTVLEEFWYKNKTFCKVRCSCGKVFDTRKDSIKSNKTKSCGHLTQFDAKDIAGERFGRLIAIEPTAIENGAYRWLCKCDCGNTTEVKIGNLTQGITRSCGCLRIDYRTEKMRETRKKMEGVKYVESTFIPALGSKIPKNNTSGVKGVFYDNTRQKWVAVVEFQGEKKLYKRFEKKEDAIKARKEAEEKYFKPMLEKYDKKGGKVNVRRTH